MPQVSVKQFWLDDPAWVPPIPGVGDHWYYYQMGRVIPFLLGAWEGTKWLLGSSFSWMTHPGLHLVPAKDRLLVHSCSWALVGWFCLA
ncbi:hypothetical protein LCGC14_1226610 [marine sediment metagenome]|uniref:Uncharacterized protein n=1 Tax=marine sediment metagenome TaxID=412755 RepID=A0A0F9PE38_9ZZZZ